MISRSLLRRGSTEEFAEEADSCYLAVGHATDEVDHDGGTGMGLTHFTELRHHDVSGD